MSKSLQLFLVSLLMFTVAATRQFGFVQEVDTIAEAVRLNPRAIHQTIHINGYWSANDGGGGRYRITNSVVGTNYGGRVAMSTAGWSLDRVDEGRIDVKAWGAKGDDTTEDHVRIKAALQWGAGKEVYVPTSSGAYIIGETLLIPQNTVFRIHGHIRAKNGVNFELIREDGGALTYSGTDPNPQLSNITILGDGQGIVDGNSINAVEPFNVGGTAQYTGHVIRIIGVQGVIIDGLTVKDGVLFCMAIQACKNVKITGCTVLTGNGNNSAYFNGKNQDGIHIFDTQDFVISNNYVESTDDNYAATARDCYVRNGVIANNVGKHKIIFTETYATIGSNCRVSLEGNGTTNAFVKNIVVANNVFKDGANGMYIDSTVGKGIRLHNISVVNNSIQDKTDLGTASSRPPYAIFAQGIDGFVVKGNRLDNIARYGLYAQLISNMLVDGNSFEDFLENPGITRNAGIILSRPNGSLTNVVIRGNTFDRMLGNAITVPSGSGNMINLVIQGNRINQCAYGSTTNANSLANAAIRIGGVTQPVISGNLITDTAAAGMEIYNSPGSTIDGNTVDKMGLGGTFAIAYGIYVYHDTGSLVDTAMVNGNKVSNCDGKGIFVRNVEKPVVSNNLTRNNCQAVSTEQEILVAITGDGSTLPVTSGVSGAIHGNTMFNSTATVNGLAIQLLTSPTFTGTPLILWDNMGLGMTTKLNVSTANGLATDSSIFGGQLIAGVGAAAASSHHYLYHLDNSASGTKTAALIERQYNAAGSVSVAKEAATVISRFAGSGGSSSIVGGLNVVSSQDQVSDNVSQVRGITVTPRITGAGSVTTMSGISVFPTFSSTGSANDSRTFWARSPTIASTGVPVISTGLYIDEQKVAGVTTGRGIYQASINDVNFIAGPITGVEIATPNAPAANEGTIFWQDNGSGKTQLAVRFNTGATQVLATQP